MVGFLAPLLGAIGGWAGSAVGQTVIGAGTSLLSAKMGQPKNKWQVPDYAGIRSKAEAAGFNPLTALSAAPGQAVQSQNYMGAAIADAGLMLADTLAKNKNAGQVSKLAQSNAALTKKVQALTLRPKVGGVYAQRQATPSMRAALGGSNGQGVARSSGGVSAPSVAGGGGAGVGASANPAPLLTSDTLDPRRGIDNTDIVSDAGYIIIDNPALGEPIRVPAVNGEILDLGQSAVVGGSYVAQKMSKGTFADHVVGGFTRMERDGNARFSRGAKGVADWFRQPEQAARDQLGDDWAEQQFPRQLRVSGYGSTKKWKAASTYWGKPPRSAWPQFQLGPY